MGLKNTPLDSKPGGDTRSLQATVVFCDLEEWKEERRNTERKERKPGLEKKRKLRENREEKKQKSKKTTYLGVREMFFKVLLYHLLAK